jgi:tRNA dimethylallyltransferase
VKVVVISGPTASGKTQMSIDLAQKFGGEVVNFDSLLLYQEITIGTAKPTPQEMKSIPHHMINVRSILNPMNAASYSEVARPIVERLLSQGKTVYLVGGSGFYLQALLKGMYDSPTTPLEITQRSDTLYQQEGISPFRIILKEHDPKSFKRYHENDHYRIRRAVEHWWTHHSPLSAKREKKEAENASLDKPTIYDWPVLHIFLDLPKEQHHQIIKARTKSMIKAGLVEEVQALLEAGFTGQEKPLQAIGYKETLDFIRGEIKTEAELIERITISTRQLAKAQRTWFKREKEKMEFHPLEQRPRVFVQVEDFLKN